MWLWPLDDKEVTRIFPVLFQICKLTPQLVHISYKHYFPELKYMQYVHFFLAFHNFLFIKAINSSFSVSVIRWQKDLFKLNEKCYIYRLRLAAAVETDSGRRVGGLVAE